MGGGGRWGCNDEAAVDPYSRNITPYNPLSPLFGGVLGAGLLARVLRVGLGAIDLLDLVRRREHHLVEINLIGEG